MTSIDECLEFLRETTYKVALSETEKVWNDESENVRALCLALERCMDHGLVQIGSKETVSLWGLVQYTNIAQQKRHKVWEQRQRQMKEQQSADAWYQALFKDELESIHQSATAQNIVIDLPRPYHANPTTVDPATPGLNASIRAAMTLTKVQTSRGRVRAWIRQCLNTHILSKCLAGIMDPQNAILLTKYLGRGALMGDEDAREVFVGLTSTLDRLHFGFNINNPLLDERTLPLKPSPEEESTLLQPQPTKVPRPPSMRHVLSAKTLIMFDKLRYTPSHVLCPKVLNDTSIKPCLSKTFNVPLHVLVSDPNTCEIAGLDRVIGVPNIVEATCRLIDTSVNERGLFTTALDSRRQQALLVLVKKIGILSIWNSVHDGCFVLVQFLKELPQALLQDLNSPNILQEFVTGDEADRAVMLRRVVNDLPWYIKPTIARIFITLARALEDDHASQNGLNLSILSAMIAGPLFHPVRKILGQEQQQVLKQICEMMLSRSSELFQDIQLNLNNRRMVLDDKVQVLEDYHSKIISPIDMTNRDHIKLFQDLWHQLIDAQNAYSPLGNLDPLPIVVKDGSPDEVEINRMISSEAWAFFGFDSTNLVQELKGAGVLVLECLIFFMQQHGEIARQILHMRSQRCRANYPIPQASVHIVRMIATIFQCLDTREELNTFRAILRPGRWIRWCDGDSLKMTESGNNVSVNPDGQDSSECSIDISRALELCTTPLWRLLGDSKSFMKMYGMTMLMFDRNWARSGATCMDFNTILNETRAQLISLLKLAPESVEHMWQTWFEERHKQIEERENGNDTTKAATWVQIMRYRVMWPGGVHVRASPSKTSKSIGRRNLYATIETVVQMGNWVKIRDVPGLADSGWICLKEGDTALLQRID